MLYFVDWKLALPVGETKIDRPAKHDLQLCRPVCQATFTLNFATAAYISTTVCSHNGTQHTLSTCLRGLPILTCCDH